jgi:drug/metabolite transporter (DMT)-like permease
VLSIGLLLILGEAHRRWRAREKTATVWKKAWPWALANAVVGPALGVSCYQWALKLAPSSIVLPIVATTPLAAMLLALVMEGIRPTRRAIAGSILAVVGVIVLVRNA